MKILIIDDEKLARINILRQLDGSFQIFEAYSFEDGKRKIEQHIFDICYIDLKLDQSKELKGLDLVKESVKKGFYTVVMTSINDEEIVEAAYDAGCQDVYNKGNEAEHISETLNRYLLSKESFIEEYLFKDVLPTQNKKYKEDLKKLLKIIHTDIPICLFGESGTGKSFLAKTIHHLSKKQGKFIELNCANFSGDTLKSELFGHIKGSFTGANFDKPGKLEEAHKGTLFLDEIGSMSLEMQEILLKAIEEKSFYPLGSNKLVKSDFRVICATLDNLELLIKSGKFRFDLFQRINGYSFIQPSLIERREDILPLLKSKLSSSRKIIFKDDARKLINEYSWPGNIRELLRFAELISQCDAGVIKQEHVKEFIKQTSTDEFKTVLTPGQFELIKKDGLRVFLELITKEAINESLKGQNQKVRPAIKELKISSKTFYRYYDSKEKKMSKSGGHYELQ